MYDATSTPPPSPSSGWRGAYRSGRRRKLDASLVNSGNHRRRRWPSLKRAGRELAEHPAETVALLAMAVALSRLLRARERASPQRGDNAPRQRGAVIPISVMAALCILGLAAPIGRSGNR